MVLHTSGTTSRPKIVPLSNLNIFRRNQIRGFITAKGKLKGEINKPEIQINFNVDYPHYKGLRIREIWEGEIKNQSKEFLINMKNRYKYYT